MPDRDLYVPPNVSTEEVYRLLLSMRGDLRESINSKASVDEVTHLKERIIDLESWQTWAMRLGIPALLGIVLNLLNTLNGGI